MARKLSKYRQILSDYLSEYVTDRMPQKDIQFQFVKDIEHGHFQVLEMAWIKDIFHCSIIFHFEIKPDGKVWLWVNNTDILVTEDLIDKGIPKKEIVLGFHAPEVRAYTGYAVA